MHKAVQLAQEKATVSGAQWLQEGQNIQSAQEAENVQDAHVAQAQEAQNFKNAHVAQAQEAQNVQVAQAVTRVPITFNYCSRPGMLPFCSR